MDKADLAGKGGTLICSMELTHERIQTLCTARRGARGNHESHCKPLWANHYPNFNEDTGCRRLRRVVSNHLAIIASGALGLTSAMNTILSGGKR